MRISPTRMNPRAPLIARKTIKQKVVQPLAREIDVLVESLTDWQSQLKHQQETAQAFRDGVSNVLMSLVSRSALVNHNLGSYTNSILIVSYSIILVSKWLLVHLIDAVQWINGFSWILQYLLLPRESTSNHNEEDSTSIPSQEYGFEA